MKILVSNDDGIDSPGIYALVKELQKIGDVTVVAPDRQQSAVGHSLTISSPLRATPFKRNGEMFGYAINGTPSDSVKLALAGLLDDKPDIVVSGINHGKNTGVNILYSGTVSAATEGMLSGVKSMAVSLDNHSWEANMTSAAKYAAKVAKELPNIDLPEDTLLNMNVPDIPFDEIRGIKLVRHADSYWKDKFEERRDPFNTKYYWFSGEYQSLHDKKGTDDYAIRNNYVSITPIQYNLTNFHFLEQLSKITLEK